MDGDAQIIPHFRMQETGQQYFKRKPWETNTISDMVPQPWHLRECWTSTSGTAGNTLAALRCSLQTRVWQERIQWHNLGQTWSDAAMGEWACVLHPFLSGTRHGSCLFSQNSQAITFWKKLNIMCRCFNIWHGTSHSASAGTYCSFGSVLMSMRCL